MHIEAPPGRSGGGMSATDSPRHHVLKVGLIVNPIAGVGGSLGLKGSDNLPAGLEASVFTRAETRAQRALSPLRSCASRVHFVCWAGAMGQSVLGSLGFGCEVLGACQGEVCSAGDTKRAALKMSSVGVDVLLFVGGDGTARDIYDALGESTPVLGIPAGVKMHSGVFTVSPEAAGELLVELLEGGLVALAPQEVRDIDEVAFQSNVVKSRFYGEMPVPAQGRFLQHTKVGGVECSELAAADIADWVVACMEPGTSYVIGPGSTTAAIMAEMGVANTLLGVDVVRDREILQNDCSEQELLSCLSEFPGPAKIIVTAIGGQGHVFGRGNQQISPEVIRRVGLECIDIVAAKSKIAALQGRPLLLDTNDPELDRELTGYRPVITGYQNQVLYRLAAMA